MYETNYQNLAAAIVGQACEDYCYGLRNIKKFKDDKDKLSKIKNEVKEIENFIKTDMLFYMSSDVDTTRLLKQLKKIANNKEKYKVVRFLGNNTQQRTADYDTYDQGYFYED